MANEQEHPLWVALAELFFLDTESQNYDFDRVTRLLKEAKWSSQKTRRALIELIAPIAGHNLGFLIWPVIGEWAGFDQTDLCRRIQCLSERRKKWPKWFFCASDWYCERMLKQLDMDRLLNLMSDPRELQ
jgi:hypothetical protein